MPNYTEIDSDLLLLAASGSDRDRQEIADRLQDMTPAELRRLRAALNDLDNLIDEAFFDRHLARY